MTEAEIGRALVELMTEACHRVDHRLISKIRLSWKARACLCAFAVEYGDRFQAKWWERFRGHPLEDSSVQAEPFRIVLSATEVIQTEPSERHWLSRP